jgi:1,4-dihydroxy-2-naphthoate octaprenyltransferase
VVLASIPYALGPTTVIFGKHIDKYEPDKAKGIHTLPVIIGERAARGVAKAMFVLQYVLVVALVFSGFFTPVMLIVLVALRTFVRVLPMFRAPKPAERPADYPVVWPNYFVAAAFIHNREFGLLYLLGLILDTAIKAWI